MKWGLQYAPRVQKDLKNIPQEARQRIRAALDKLQENPKSVAKYLRNHPVADYSLRIGTYRVLFDLDHENKTIIVLKIGHRKDVYR